MQADKFKNRLRGAAADSLILTFVKVVTAALGLLTTKLLSTQFTLLEYGTYSQAMLLVSTVTSISILGLTDATNYYYNAADDDVTKQQNIATVFGIQYFIGILSGLLICLLHVPIVRYFDNAALRPILYLAAWMPIFNNLIPMLQVLFISIGKAKVIAIRNFLFSSARLLIVSIACFITNNIRTIFVLLLVLDVAQVVYFYLAFAKNRFRIRLRSFRAEMIGPILRFSIPMAVFVFTSALSRDIDKYVISYFTDTATLAVYTNAAKMLPFDLLTASFLTVLIPVVTRQVRTESYADAKTTLRAYLRVGYLGTWMLVSGAIVCARELMLFLYDEKYLAGLPVFVVYLFVEMVRFANVSLILVAKGRTKTLMKWSILALLANAALNVPAYLLLGVIGPALTTLLVTFVLMVIYLSASARVLQTSFGALFDWRELSLVAVQLLAVCGAAYALKRLLLGVIGSYVIVMILTYGVCLCALLFLNRKRVLSCLSGINRLK